MLTPSVTHPLWHKLVTGQVQCQFDCLAVKVFLGAAKLQEIAYQLLTQTMVYVRISES